MHLGVSLLIVSTQCILRIETCLLLVLFLPIVLPLLVSEDKGQSLPVEFLTIPGHFRWYLSDVRNSKFYQYRLKRRTMLAGLYSSISFNNYFDDNW